MSYCIRLHPLNDHGGGVRDGITSKDCVALVDGSRRQTDNELLAWAAPVQHCLRSETRVPVQKNRGCYTSAFLLKGGINIRFTLWAIQGRSVPLLSAIVSSSRTPFSLPFSRLLSSLPLFQTRGFHSESGPSSSHHFLTTRGLLGA